MHFLCVNIIISMEIISRLLIGAIHWSIGCNLFNLLTLLFKYLLYNIFLIRL